ncbi:MAG: right-handed parallel beta-helix repeat-containing protein [candidate division Zixibacteria bacterium]|nr:right-handed parallel beta-helix repeat-containing protein [candidate division Zixibacteria bacterium]
MIRVKTILLVLLMVINVVAVSPDELPFGAFYLDDTTTTQIEILHDVLGFNLYVQNHPTISTLNKFADAGITVSIRGDGNNKLHTLSQFHYALFEVEEGDSSIRIYHCGGDTASEGDTRFWVSYNDSEDILFGPNSHNWPCWPDNHVYSYPKLNSRYGWQADPEVASDTVHYFIEIRAKIDVRNGTTDTIANLWVLPNLYGYGLVDTLSKWELRDSDFPASDTWTTIEKEFHFADTLRFYDIDNIADTSTKVDISYALTTMIKTTGNREVSIDWIKIYDRDGKRLVETDFYSQDIEDFVEDYTGVDSLWGWCFAEGGFSTIPVIGAILDTVRTRGEMPDWGGMSILPGKKELYQYWFDYVDSDVLSPFSYPFLDNGIDSTTYAGYNSLDSAIYLQNRLNSMAEEYTLMYQTVNNNDADLWLEAQAYYSNSGTIENRKPTHSEFLCQTYMILAHGARGILYWKYNSSVNCYGIINDDDDSTMWYAIRDDINPYIKAIDEYYMPLVWDTTYAVSPNETIVGQTIKSIRAVPNHPDSISPDTGWFHVGEYYDNAGMRYFMLVNRACSQGVDDSTEAGSITAIVKLNRSYFNNAERLLVIDIADSINHLYPGTDSTEWIAVSETTYTCLYDDKLYFTTILKAGEGRLFKIQTLGNPTSVMDYDVCQGEFTYDTTLTISSSDTVSYKCPSILTFPQHDTLIINGGLFTTGCDTGDSLGLVAFAAETTTVSWKGLLFSGSSAIGNLDYSDFKQVVPTCITIDDTASVVIQNSKVTSYTYGIHITDSGRLNAANCSFEDTTTATNGIYNESGDSVMATNCYFKGYSTGGICSNSGYLEVDSCSFDDIGLWGIYANSSDAKIEYCNFINIGNYGIRTISAELEVSHCDFDSIENYGIYADSAESEIDNCDFIWCEDYAIYIDGHPSGSYDSTKITDCDITLYSSGSAPSGSHYGIRVDNINKVRLFRNVIRKYAQGGIKFDHSNTKVEKNCIYDCNNYGIYSYASDCIFNQCDFDSLECGLYLRTGSDGIVRYCDFDSPNLVYGVRTYALSYPDLGDSINNQDSGNNTFRNCSKYYIYNGSGIYTIKAEGNYFGGGPPPVGKIYGLVDYTPWLTAAPGSKGKLGEIIIPYVYQLNHNYPNPFNPNTTISFSLADPGYTSISIYNILGQKVNNLVDEYKSSGNYSVIWDGRNKSGTTVSSGIYFYRIESGEFIDTKKMLLLR